MDDKGTALAAHQRLILETFALRRHAARRRWRDLVARLGVR